MLDPLISNFVQDSSPQDLWNNISLVPARPWLDEFESYKQFPHVGWDGVPVANDSEKCVPPLRKSMLLKARNGFQLLISSPLDKYDEQLTEHHRDPTKPRSVSENGFRLQAFHA